MSRGSEALHVAVVSTPHIKTPPEGYGGCEAVAGGLAEELVRRGHEVTLFATDDSHTSANLRWFASALPRGPYGHQGYREIIHLAHALRHGHYDLVLNHCVQAVPILELYREAPALTTLHYRPQVLADFPHLGYVAVSRRQAALCREAGLNVLGVVYNGIDPTPYRVVPEKGDYLLWIGRFHVNKGPDLAIEVAERLGARLLLAAPPPPEDQEEFFAARVRPRLRGSIEWIGGAEGEAKYRLFEGARCTLCPVRWEEPFGLVMIESMASGTPVVGFRRGSVPEIIVDGVTGYVVDDVEDMTAAVQRVEAINPHACRERVERHFTAAAMTEGYLRLAASLSPRVAETLSA
ncbi:MAG: glycosyltransferase family 4 protein [Anaerolineae bacterium]|nr:glycosyltransferase family 4 protein [Anaerolineae bacterium]